MLIKCFKSRTALILDRIEQLTKQQAGYVSRLSKVSKTRDKDIMEKALHNEECLTRAIDRMWAMYKKERR